MNKVVQANTACAEMLTVAAKYGAIRVSQYNTKSIHV
jgi:hypothetical protein